MSLSRLGKILGLDQARAWDSIAAYLWVPVILFHCGLSGSPFGDLSLVALLSSALLLIGLPGRHALSGILSLIFLTPLLADFIELKFYNIWSSSLIFDLLPLPIYLVSVCAAARNIKRQNVAKCPERATP